jgi:N-acyl-D-amino-acid deacylase
VAMARFLCGVILALFSAATVSADEPKPTGYAGPGTESIDKVVLDILDTHKIPGSAVAIAKDGRLVFARGYGLADLGAHEPMEPRSRFNLASCTKPFTAVAILKLVDEGKLKLDDRVYELLKDRVKPPAGAKVDERYYQITVRQMLHHAAGLSRDGKGRAQNTTLEQFAGENMREPLLYEPGTKTEYSNLGFLILRLVIEHAAGDYEKFCRSIILEPCGIHDMQVDSKPSGYFKGEVHRYIAGKEKPLPGGQGAKFEGEGGCWIASAVDLMRFMTALERSGEALNGKPLISAESYKEMLSPLPPPFQSRNRYNGLGWDGVEKKGNKYFYEKNGGLAGIATYMEHQPRGVNFAILFNASPADKKDTDESAGAWRKSIIDAIHQFNDWPQVDYFDKFR